MFPMVLNSSICDGHLSTRPNHDSNKVCLRLVVHLLVKLYGVHLPTLGAVIIIHFSACPLCMTISWVSCLAVSFVCFSVQRLGFKLIEIVISDLEDWAVVHPALAIAHLPKHLQLQKQPSSNLMFFTHSIYWHDIIPPGSNTLCISFLHYSVMMLNHPFRPWPNYHTRIFSNHSILPIALNSMP